LMILSIFSYYYREFKLWSFCLHDISIISGISLN
jgi:hypothetical protein